MPEDWRAGGFGLYIHWPFCQAKCPYCDFNSHVTAKIDQNRWNRAYISEIRRIGAQTEGRILNSVFFGGGTPSLMDVGLVNSIIKCVRATWASSNSFEVTLEANPTSVEAGRFAGYRDAGVNRLSLGIQALNDDDLRALGRLHSVAEARTAFDLARSCFERVSFDLIYARQNQSLEGWKSELDQALSIAADHLSLYQLSVEPGTAFGDRHAAGKLPGLPDEDAAADLYLLTQDMCGAAGLPAYEVSNHAAPGCESRHNMIYWRHGDYVGIGPGAHGRLTLNATRFATETPLTPVDWLQRVERDKNGENLRRALTPVEQGDEFLMMGLRLSEGISLSRYRALTGFELSSDKINALQALSMVEQIGDRLRGAIQSRLDVVIFREGTGATFDISLERAHIIPDTVTYGQENGIVFLKISS
ncbi:MAG: radical SAM family heme chaperone HemW, partial [Paracoccaceae bacterium]